MPCRCPWPTGGRSRPTCGRSSSRSEPPSPTSRPASAPSSREPASMASLGLVEDAGLRRAQRTALGLAAAGGTASLLGALLGPQQFLRSYLVAWVFWTGLALGALALSMIHHVTGGRWGVVIRRLLESATLTLPVQALLFVPIALGMHELYVWAQPAHVAHDPVLQAKSGYLTVPFFLVRTAGYFVAWAVVAAFPAPSCA